MASVPDTRVEVRIACVHREVHQDHHGDDHEIDALDDGIVTLVDGVEEKAPHAGQPKIVSKITVPPRICAIWMPRTVMTVMSEFLRLCLSTTALSRTPLAHAVRT